MTTAQSINCAIPWQELYFYYLFDSMARRLLKVNAKGIVVAKGGDTLKRAGCYTLTDLYAFYEKNG